MKTKCKCGLARQENSLARTARLLAKADVDGPGARVFHPVRIEQLRKQLNKEERKAFIRLFLSQIRRRLTQELLT